MKAKENKNRNGQDTEKDPHPQPYSNFELFLQDMGNLLAKIWNFIKFCFRNPKEGFMVILWYAIIFIVLAFITRFLIAIFGEDFQF